MAIGEGLDAIRLGRAEVMLCGGTDAVITRTGIAGFAALRALSRRNDDPAAASRPFDADRDGFVVGEAGAILVLEELEHASKRGAKIYAELSGYGVSSDAEHITEPDPTGEHPARAMRMAFADARISPGEISRNGSCTADGRIRYVQQRRLAARGAVKLVPLISSVYRPYFGRCGLLWPTGSAPGNASLAKSLPNPD